MRADEKSIASKRQTQKTSVTASLLEAGEKQMASEDQIVKAAQDYLLENHREGHLPLVMAAYWKLEAGLEVKPEIESHLWFAWANQALGGFGQPVARPLRQRIARELCESTLYNLKNDAEFKEDIEFVIAADQAEKKAKKKEDKPKPQPWSYTKCQLIISLIGNEEFTTEMMSEINHVKLKVKEDEEKSDVQAKIISYQVSAPLTGQQEDMGLKREVIMVVEVAKEAEEKFFNAIKKKCKGFKVEQLECFRSPCTHGKKLDEIVSAFKKKVTAQTWADVEKAMGEVDVDGHHLWYFVGQLNEQAGRLTVENGSIPVKPEMKEQLEAALAKHTDEMKSWNMQGDNTFVLIIDLGEVNLSDEVNENTVKEGGKRLIEFENLVLQDPDVKACLASDQPKEEAPKEEAPVESALQVDLPIEVLKPTVDGLNPGDGDQASDEWNVMDDILDLMKNRGYQQVTLNDLVKEIQLPQDYFEDALQKLKQLGYVNFEDVAHAATKMRADQSNPVRHNHEFKMTDYGATMNEVVNGHQVHIEWDAKGRRIWGLVSPDEGLPKYGDKNGWEFEEPFRLDIAKMNQPDEVQKALKAEIEKQVESFIQRFGGDKVNSAAKEMLADHEEDYLVDLGTTLLADAVASECENDESEFHDMVDKFVRSGEDIVANLRAEASHHQMDLADYVDREKMEKIEAALNKNLAPITLKDLYEYDRDAAHSEILGAIGHGVSAADEPAVVDWLKEKGATHYDDQLPYFEGPYDQAYQFLSDLRAKEGEAQADAALDLMDLDGMQEVNEDVEFQAAHVRAEVSEEQIEQLEKDYGPMEDWPNGVFDDFDFGSAWEAGHIYPVDKNDKMTEETLALLRSQYPSAKEFEDLLSKAHTALGVPVVGYDWDTEIQPYLDHGMAYFSDSWPVGPDEGGAVGAFPINLDELAKAAGIIHAQMMTASETTLFANPYGDADGFYFKNMEEYEAGMAKLAATGNEEVEIEYIDGDDAALFNELKIGPATLKQWFDEIEPMEESEKASAYFAAQRGEDIDGAQMAARDDKYGIRQQNKTEYVDEFLEEAYPEIMSGPLGRYIDTESYARDLELGGDIDEFEFDGSTWLATHANQ